MPGKFMRMTCEDGQQVWKISLESLRQKKMKTAIGLKLERLEEKYKTNPKRYTPPPKI